jgi:hypothetical protein
MRSPSEQRVREVEQSRARLSETFRELRTRITPGQVVDQFIDYAREGPVAESLRNLAREIRENPLPLVLIGIGIGWLMVASSRSSREAIASAADSVTRKTAEISGAANRAATRARGWDSMRRHAWLTGPVI